MKSSYIANERIKNNDDILLMLDAMLRDPVGFWNDFYNDRNKGIPFFTEQPDENLNF